MFANKDEFKKEFKERVVQKYGRSYKECSNIELYEVLGEVVNSYASKDLMLSKDYVEKHQKKQLIYFSMEFLIGRLLTNNLINLGIYNTVKDGLDDLNIDLNELENQEADAGLGNGGLGRLAACFLDSIASLRYPGHGNSLRYQFGFFKQKIIDGKQVEVPDNWLKYDNVWETRKPEKAVEVEFYGNAETYVDTDGRVRCRTANSMHVRAVPYDVMVMGYNHRAINTLRLWSAEPVDDYIGSSQSFSDYLKSIHEICHSLYPDDSNEHGKMLRLRQQYFLVSAGLKSLIREHKRVYGTLNNLCEKLVFQLNDTHPILAIPELMRILMDEEGFGWDEAWYQVQHSMAYTNHTVMAEALEKWPTQYMMTLLPRIYMIIEEIDRRFVLSLKESGHDDGFIYRVRIIKDGMIHMPNLGIHAGFSVNGVASLHTEICKKDTFKDLYSLYPKKFNNKTNGITHRRWFLACNPELAKLVTSLIGDRWITHPSDLAKLEKFVDDKKVLNKVRKIKLENKIKFAKYIKEHNGIDVDVNSIFDTQVKRLHAYKRQLMNVLRIMYYYLKLKSDKNFKMYPHTFIFGAKAAPSYSFAKNVIELINCVANKVNNDPEVNKFMKVVFIENYGVSSSEIIIPGSDVSEQISTAGKEASGTSNMKFMINGAITLGTLDGANVEINQLVGDENSVIFGKKDYELDEIRKNNSYKAWDIYNSNPAVKMVMDSLLNGTWHDNPSEFRQVFDEIMWRNDEFFNLLDLNSYLQASKEIEKRYKHPMKWARSCLINIAKAGYFSSDRTIEQYVEDIWHLERIR